MGDRVDAGRRCDFPSVDAMSTQHIDTLIIGAGQAGLATGYFLAQRGLEFLIVDGADRIGDNWREQWDTLRLYTPAKYDGLPGLPFPAADPWHFPGKDEVGDYLEAYALHWDLPVRMSTRVEALVPAPGGGYLATLGPDAVSTISCDQVVIATGTFGRTPWVPAAGGRSRSRHRATALQRVPAAGSAAQRAGAGGGGLALREGRRLRRGADPRDDPLRPRPRRARASGSSHEPAGSGLPLHALDLQARAQPPDADGPQGDGRGPLPRRPQSAGQAGRPGRPRGGTHRGPVRRRAGRPADARRRARASKRPASSGAPASSSGSTGSSCRSSTNGAGRWSTAASSRGPRVCTSAA